MFRFDPPRAVLDTNVVLDWLVFGNAGVRPIVDAILAGRLRWVATTGMQAELSEVLRRGLTGDWPVDHEHIAAHWKAWAHIVETPPAPSLASPLRCTDTDDQKFIDLALHDADWLFSRDRAVLRLARRASAHGLRIVKPEAWTPDP